MSIIIMPQARPILFSPKMVKAIIDGKKTQTRRIKFKYQKGQSLYVRESFTRVDSKIVYRADVEDDSLFKWKPSIFMPKADARLFLKIEDVRIEKLKSISLEDVEAEGFESQSDYFGYWDGLNASNGYAVKTDPDVYVVDFSII